MLDFIITYYGNQIIGLILCAVGSALGFIAAKVYKYSADDDTKRAVARSAALFVEQVWKTIHGKEKLEKALEQVEILLRKKGIPFDAEEMTIHIEAAVAELNKVFEKSVKTD